MPPESYGNLLQHFTGSKEHNVALREDAVRRGLSRLRVRGHGRRDRRGADVGDEEELYAHLGYESIPPELRENLGELEAARSGELPELVELRRPARRPALPLDVVGDGKDTIEEMARAALARGYEYLAHDRPLALPARRAARGAVGGDRRR